MKKSLVMSVCVCLIIVCTFINNIYSQEKRTEIGFLLDDFNVDRWYEDRDYFIKKAKDLGYEVKIEVAYSDTTNQLNQAIKLIEDGVKVLVIVPVNSDAAAKIVQIAKKSEVKVISYDRLINNCNLDYYISYNNLDVGRLQAKYVTTLKPKGNYIIISGPPIDNNSQVFRKGQQEILQPFIDKNDIQIVLDKPVSEWTDMESFMIIDDYFTNNKGSVDVIIAANDGLAKGCIDALELHNLKGTILVTGQDGDVEGCKQIVAGSQIMTVYKSIKELAFKAAEISVQLCKGEKKIETNNTVNNGYKNIPSILLTPVSVDKNNLKEIIISDGVIKEEEILH